MPQTLTPPIPDSLSPVPSPTPNPHHPTPAASAAPPQVGDWVYDALWNRFFQVHRIRHGKLFRADPGEPVILTVEFVCDLFRMGCGEFMKGHL